MDNIYSDHSDMIPVDPLRERDIEDVHIIANELINIMIKIIDPDSGASLSVRNPNGIFRIYILPM